MQHVACLVEVRKKQKKVQSLQRMLAEIGALTAPPLSGGTASQQTVDILPWKGAESDSDAPPDERAPAFFVNEDGTKALACLRNDGVHTGHAIVDEPKSVMQVPRPRTRKERMGP